MARTAAFRPNDDRQGKAGMTSELARYEASTPTSARMQAEAQRYLPGGSSRGTAYFSPYPFFVNHTEGHYVIDVDGNRYLDFMLNATTYALGHANQRVVDAVRSQAANGLSYSTPHESQTRLAMMLCERVPSVEKIRFTNSGTEGTLNAIRAARVHRQAQDRKDRRGIPREPRIRIGKRVHSP